MLKSGDKKSGSRVVVQSFDDAVRYLGGREVFEKKSETVRTVLFALKEIDPALNEDLHSIMLGPWGSFSTLSYYDRLKFTKEFYKFFPDYGVLMYVLEALNLSDSTLERETTEYLSSLLDLEGVEGLAAEYLLNVDILEGIDRTQMCWPIFMKTPWTEIRLRRLFEPLLYMEVNVRQDLLSSRYLSVDLPESLMHRLCSTPNQSMKGGESRRRFEAEFKVLVQELVDYLKKMFPGKFSTHLK